LYNRHYNELNTISNLNYKADVSVLKKTSDDVETSAL